MDRPVIGILMLDHQITRPPGDLGNPATFSFPVLHKVVQGVSLERLLNRDPACLDPLVESAQSLVDAGVSALSSGCGFFVFFQSELRARVKVPVMLSSLLQIPLVQQMLGTDERIGILTAHAGRLTREHLLKAGMDPRRPVKVLGMEGAHSFRKAILIERGVLEFEKVEAEVVAKARELVSCDGGEPRIGAIILECTNLPPYAKSIQEAVGLPVYDVTTMIESTYSALARRRFQ